MTTALTAGPVTFRVPPEGGGLMPPPMSSGASAMTARIVAVRLIAFLLCVLGYLNSRSTVWSVPSSSFVWARHTPFASTLLSRLKMYRWPSNRYWLVGLDPWPRSFGGVGGGVPETCSTEMRAMADDIGVPFTSNSRNFIGTVSPNVNVWQGEREQVDSAPTGGSKPSNL